MAYFYEVEYNNFNPNDPKATWGADSKRTNFAEDNPDESIYNHLNVWRDNYPMDNVFFGLVSCEVEKQVIGSWWQAYGIDNYFANLFHESDVENVSCP